MRCSVFCLCLIASGLTAQEAPQKVEEQSLQIFSLKYLDAEKAAQLVTELILDDGTNPKAKVAAVGANRLLVNAHEKQLVKISALLRTLDTNQPVEKPGTRLLIKMYSLQNVIADKKLETVLQATIGKDNLTGFSLDPRLNTVIVRGSEETHAQIELLLKGLDIPPAVAPKDNDIFQIRLLWLMEGVPPKGEVRAIPKGLESVTAQLKKLGMEKLWLQGQMLINAKVQSQFETQGIVPALFAEGKTVHWSVSGIMNLQANADRPELDLHIEARDKTEGAKRTAPNSYCFLSTRISLKAGQTVMLGTTPIAGNNSVFVLQLLSTENKK